MFNEICLKQVGYASFEAKLLFYAFQGKQSLPEAATREWVLAEREKVETSMEEFHCRGPLTTQRRRTNQNSHVH
jgi:hypothetical protein